MAQEDKVQSRDRGVPCRDDPRISSALMIATYVVAGAGISLGIFHTIGGSPARALHAAVPFMVGTVGVLAMVRHSLFHASDARRADVVSDPFYMIELGFANGAFGVLALAVCIADWGVTAEATLTLAYALYLAMALLLFQTRARARGLDAGLFLGLVMWALQVGFMVFFAAAAMRSVHPAL